MKCVFFNSFDLSCFSCFILWKQWNACKSL